MNTLRLFLLFSPMPERAVSSSMSASLVALVIAALSLLLTTLTPDTAIAQKTSKKAPTIKAADKSTEKSDKAPVADDQPAFEGVVFFRKGAPGSKIASNVTMYIKGDRFMADEQGEKIKQKLIVDGKKKAIFMIMDKEKMIMEMPMEKMASKTPEPKLPLKTGKTQAIAGYECEQWLDKQYNGEVELWTNATMGRLFIPDGPMGAGLIPSASMQRLLKQGSYFPFLMIERDRTGKEITRLEVTNVEKKPVDDAVFEAPANYQRMEMPGSER
jgi:hypothetical protein